MPRTINTRYQDPLDAIWLSTAQSIGLRVRRSSDAYASTDGRGELVLSDKAGMDPDDCLPQMVLHEICHFLVSGPNSFAWVDWGLDNEGQRDDVFEHACLRLQAALLDPRGLRQVLAPTTDFRAYYDALPHDPFSTTDAQQNEAVVRALAGYSRRHRRPVGEHLDRALDATAAIALAAAPYCQQDVLLGQARPPTPLHPTGIPLKSLASSLQDAGGPQSALPSPSCGTCAWANQRGPGRRVLRCTQAGNQRVSPDLPACERYESDVNCLSCGACCREAYDTVEVAPRDRAKKRHLHLMVERQGGHDMKREQGRCICLQGGVALRQLEPAIVSEGGPHPERVRPTPPLYRPGGAPFTCSIYGDRPQTCRDFTLGSANCLDARRRVGLSR